MSLSSAQLPPALDRIVQRLARSTDPKRKYELLITLAQRLKPFPEAEKTPENKVAGCASQVFVVANLEDDKIQFQGDSDSQLVKGLVALLVEGLSGLTPQEVVDLSPDFIKATGLDVSLTPSRANGFYNILAKMKQKSQGLMN
ncbi:Fe-S metabolism associated SufE [Leptolyngbya boryana NIES-2135]|jgi:cysteine desulfuration protein SufE|uniref:Fe-S metabolism associated SufE n=1 Tax=Leptolyngbya boryana NIES-2135 TaxID=1973484 RepID=A0A1Z4JCW7_LEPBY|nr:MULTISPECIES: SufE family protein [Leptolyngbya]BAY54602.1 Fe-S metabolism associated SufE [Leptolyngbya boryana NIES-2135]MBD2365594.1 SufE family protein [Leptolyngbya sp. FACHB-161]MBD2371774.1 SufE family protein [Leptolyngbya sp. FACHB-238]MBD2396199.1 SufE family protein [Leptolyngbya sp. FACHB-239]MBD2402722.1 SufE family protein [Leptolyngbya sp. FACHB-402]